MDTEMSLVETIDQMQKNPSFISSSINAAKTGGAISKFINAEREQKTPLFSKPTSNAPH